MAFDVSRIPIKFCSDDDVQRFCENEIWDFDPYRQARSARGLFKAARARFNDYRCWDLEFYQH